MTDMDAACYLKELQAYNRQGLMLTPNNNEFDTFYACAIDHAIRALEDNSGYYPGHRPTYIQNKNGSFSVKEPETEVAS